MLAQGNDKQRQFFRYVINGFVATLAHFGVLALLIDGWGMGSAAVANGFAAIIGITVSFLGNRYFVFQSTVEAIYKQASRFGLLYLAIAVVHAAVMFLVSDLAGLSYQVGFLVATGVQFILSYLGNRFLVFQ